MSGCYELDGQSDWCRIRARTVRSTSMARRARLVSHALCMADLFASERRPLQLVPAAVAYWMPSVVEIDAA